MREMKVCVSDSSDTTATTSFSEDLSEKPPANLWHNKSSWYVELGVYKCKILRDKVSNTHERERDARKTRTRSHADTQRTVPATAAIACFPHPAAPAGFDNSRLEHGNMQFPDVSYTTESSHAHDTQTETHTHTHTSSSSHSPAFCFWVYSLRSFLPAVSLSDFSPQLRLYSSLTVSSYLSYLITYCCSVPLLLLPPFFVLPAFYYLICTLLYNSLCFAPQGGQEERKSHPRLCQ